MPMTNLLFFERGLQTSPRFARAWLFSRDRRVSPEPSSTLSKATRRSLRRHLDLALSFLNLVRRYHGLGLQSNIDDDVVLADFDDQSVEDGARTNALAPRCSVRTVPQNFSVMFSLNDFNPPHFPCALRSLPKNNGDRSLEAATYCLQNLMPTNPFPHNSRRDTLTDDTQDASDHCIDGHTGLYPAERRRRLRREAKRSA